MNKDPFALQVLIEHIIELKKEFINYRKVDIHFELIIEELTNHMNQEKVRFFEVIYNAEKGRQIS